MITENTGYQQLSLLKKSVTTSKSWKLSLVVNVNIDIIVDVVSCSEFRSEFGVSNSDDIVSINRLDSSPVSSAGKISLVRSAQLLLELIDMSLRNWVNGRQEIPVN